MGDIVEIDVQGLSCPEPVMIVMDAMDEYTGKTIRVIADEAHTRTNLEKMLKHQGVQSETKEVGSHYEITFAV